MNEVEFLRKIDDFLRENEEDIVRDIARLVAVPSVSDAAHAAPGAPFGPGPRRALDEALGMARGFGLATGEDEGYLGWAELPGERPGHIATVTHLDIVPEGEGWSGGPFVLGQRDGWLIGRGVADNKGPSVLCLYLAKFFKELGQPLRYGIRVLLGCDEEIGMRDVIHYLEGHEQPLFAFSPDSDFPVCNGEKGHYYGWFTSGPAEGVFLEFDCGLAANVIPAKASCVVKLPPEALPAAKGISVEAAEGGARITAMGIGGHAASPEGTRNAIGVMVDYLLDSAICSGNEARFLQLLHLMHSFPNGSGLGIDCQDEVFHGLTVNGGVIKRQDGRLCQSIDIRYPTATSVEELNAALAAKAAEYGSSLECVSASKAFYIPADSPSIQTLLRSYNDVMGTESKPFTMGGGTYARQFKNAVSFGPGNHSSARPDFTGPEHGPNEGAYLPALLQALKIYILSVWRLQALEL